MATTTSLLRSAASARKKIQAQQDAEVAYNWNNSYQTYDNYQEYAAYLEKRARSTSDPSAALTLQKTKESAYKGFIGNEIQRKTIAIAEGTGTSTEKYNTIVRYMQDAESSGLYGLSQNLGAQAGQLYISMVEEQKRAAESQQTLNEIHAKQNIKDQNAAAKSNFDMGTDLESGLARLNTIFKEGGQIEYNKAAKKFVEAKRTQIEELSGQKLPKDITTSLPQLISGTMGAIQTYYQLAANTAIDDPEKHSYYTDKLKEIDNGKTWQTPYGAQSIQSISKLQPGRYIEDVNVNGEKTLRQGALDGYNVDESGKILPISSGKLNKEMDKKLGAQQKKQLEAMGFGNVEYDSSTGSYKVSIDKGKQDWLKNTKIGLTDNAQFRLIPTDTGFQYFNNATNELFSIATDKKGLAGLYKIDTQKGIQHMGGQYGFDQGTNNLTNNVGNLLAAANKAKAKSQAGLPLLNKAGQPQNNQLFGGSNAAMNFAMAPFAAINNASARKSAPQMVRRGDGGFNFTDANGKAISAYTYAQQTGQQFRTVLQQAANQGDSFSAQALKFAGNDGAYNPAQVSLDVAKKWNSLTWGNNVNLQTPQAARNAGQGFTKPTGTYNPLKANWWL